jgi:hypothetical protein
VYSFTIELAVVVLAVSTVPYCSRDVSWVNLAFNEYDWIILRPEGIEFLKVSIKVS